LFDQRFEDVERVIGRAREAGVERIIVPGLDFETSEKSVEMAEKYNEVYALVGVHPESIADAVEQTSEDLKKLMEGIKNLAEDSGRVVGIGEIGLDFYRDRERKTKAVQIELFRSQLELALELRLPVMIHMREAENEMRVALESLAGRSSSLASLGLRGQFHCFGASEEMLEFVLEKGFYVSFCGNVSYKTADNLRALLGRVPLGRLILETDAPYLVPEPLRGQIKTNEPGNVKIIAEFIARLKGVDVEKLAEITTRNAKCLYSGI
jgi:TatD DNase family protein